MSEHANDNYDLANDALCGAQEIADFLRKAQGGKLRAIAGPSTIWSTPQGSPPIVWAGKSGLVNRSCSNGSRTRKPGPWPSPAKELETECLGGFGRVLLGN